uniref:Hexosyltransferase n=1 Tax=Alexandrium catenella TaxID=2925 RepID=A0A7S1MNW4_ALECA
MGAFAVVSAAVVLGASGLRLHQSASFGSALRGQDSGYPQTSADPTGDESRSALPEGIVANRASGLEDADSGRVPPIDVYGPLWEKRHASEKRLSEPLPSSIRLILGLFTVPQDAEYREVVRRTWLDQTGVCYWQREPREGCQVYVAFVIGKSGAGDGAGGVNLTSEQMAEAHREPGMFVLDVEENMNFGKSPAWFGEAQKAFPWATHIGKIDMDTYPFIRKLVFRMAGIGTCLRLRQKYEFIGRPHHPNFAPEFQSACKEVGCLKQFRSSQDDRVMIAKPGMPFKFMSGELYILSYPLVGKVDWDNPDNYQGTEDSVVARLVDKAAQNHRFCVVARRLDSWIHGPKAFWVDEVFANDF